jgi:ATP-dependent HslUV protease subunit HslV
LGGFAGSSADGLALFERLEAKLKQHGNQLSRAAVELAKDWRTDRMLRRLEAMLLVCDRERTFVLSGIADLNFPTSSIFARILIDFFILFHFHILSISSISFEICS